MEISWVRDFSSVVSDANWSTLFRYTFELDGPSISVAEFKWLIRSFRILYLDITSGMEGVSWMEITGERPP